MHVELFLITKEAEHAGLKSLLWLVCASTEVANSDYASVGSITGAEGDTLVVTYDPGYSGSGTTTCSSEACTTVSCTANACTATEVANSDFAATGSITATTGGTVAVTCDTGYTGDGIVTCAAESNFNDLICTANTCTSTQVINFDFATTDSIT